MVVPAGTHGFEVLEEKKKRKRLLARARVDEALTFGVNTAVTTL